MLKDFRLGKYFFYAVGEIFLVVIGILLALQINNWNQDRQNTAREMAYLEGIKQDLGSSLSELTRVINKSASVKKITETLLEFDFAVVDTLTNSDLDSLMLKAEGFTIFQPVEGTMQDLISSGNLNLIQNPSLRTQIATWEASFRMIGEREQLGKKEVQTLIDLYRDVINQYEFRRYRAPLVSDEERKRILNTPVFRNTYLGIRRNASILNRLYLEKQELIHQMIEEIEEEIQRRTGRE